MEEFLIFTVKEVLKKAVSVAAEEVIRAWGVKGELKRLEKSLSMVEALLRDAERRQLRSDALTLWLKDLRDIAYESEDVLDKFFYELLRRKVELQRRMKKNVRNFFSLSNPIAFRFKMAHKVKNINVSLDKIKIDAIGLGLVVSGVETTPQFFIPNRETHSLVDESQVVGRENEASEIVNIILINSENHDQHLSVIPIVGMGGLGKTTLSQLIFNDDKVKKHFDARIWVCVSENFEVKRILSEVLESLTHQKGRMENMNAIVEDLKQELGGKRYLLVLDDVWSENSQKWEDLRSNLLLINAMMGNIITVTTRSERVSSIMRTLDAYHLTTLSEDDCWFIFKNRAFANGGAPMVPELEEIGKEIVKKCGGVPLAAKVLGGMMRSKKERDEWLLIRAWDLPKD